MSDTAGTVGGMSVKVSVRLDGELLAAVDARAAVDGVSRSEAAHRALDEAVGVGPVEPMVLDRERILRGLVRSLEERGSVRAAELLLVEVERERREAVDGFAELDALDAPPPRRRSRPSDTP